MAAHSCDRTAAAPLLRLGSGWRGRRWSGIGFQRRWTGFFDLFSLCWPFFIFNSVLFGLLIARILIQPVNLAYFIKMYVSFLL